MIKAGSSNAKAVFIPPIKTARMKASIEGRSHLITHAWDEKAKRLMRQKQGGKPMPKREAKDPAADFQAAKYLDAKGRDCIKAIAIKSAIVDAASFNDNVTKVLLRGALYVEGDLIPIQYDECVMREDMVRVGMGTADMRYRPEYRNWRASFVIEYDTSLLTPEQIIHLVNRAGFSVGIGEWRPEKNGQNGRFAWAS